MTDKVYVDLSNVCRDENLGQSHSRAAWSRWDRLRAAVTRHLDADPEFQLIADANLRSLLSRGDQLKFDREAARNQLASAAKADGLLLDEAINADAFVLSNDNFTDFMRMPGITNLRVLRWEVRDRAPRIREESLQRPHSVLITRRVEQEDRNYGHAQSADLAKRWICTNSVCSQDIVLVPNFRAGSAQCPECDSYLSHDGDWRDAAMLKVLVNDQVIARRILEDGDSVVVGRDPSDTSSLDVSEFLSREHAGRISRRHVLVRNSGGDLIAEELGSTNGSHLMHPAERRLRRRDWQPAGPLKQGMPVRLSPGVRVRLANVPVVLELSGRKFGR